jgi:hypothetical protein
MKKLNFIVKVNSKVSIENYIGIFITDLTKCYNIIEKLCFINSYNTIVNKLLLL